MQLPPQCPRCLRLERTRPEKLPGHCRCCNRWQSLFQATFRSFHEATFRHLGCVVCTDGAWCRDFDVVPEAGACAYEGHVHGVGECPGRK